MAAWIEDFPGSKPTIKQKLAAVRMSYDFLVVRQITRSNPAHSVRGPKYAVKKGKNAPVWSREDAAGFNSQGFGVRPTDKLVVRLTLNDGTASHVQFQRVLGIAKSTAARSVGDFKKIADVAALAERYAKRVKLGQETADFALEIRLRAERGLGEVLARAPKHKGLLKRGGTHSARR